MQNNLRNLIAIGLALVLLGGAPRAGAHGGLPISQTIMWRGDSLLVPTPYWGIFVGTDGGPWRWICDEAINTNQLRLIAMASDGMTLYATDKTGLTLSPDGGCSWGPVSGPVAGLDVVSVVADPVLPRRAYVLANDSTMSANTGLWRTDDAGASWSLIRGLGTDLPGGLTLSYDGTQVAVTSLSQALPRTATLHLSTDSGAGFTGRALKVPLMGAALTNLSPVFFDTAPPGTGSLYLRTIVDPNQLLLRLDGFAWMFAMLVSAMGVLVILYARYYLSPDDPAARFYSLLLGFMGAMLGVVVSGNLVQLVLFGILALIGFGMLWSAIGAGAVGSACIGHMPRRRSRMPPLPMPVPVSARARRLATSRSLVT